MTNHTPETSTIDKLFIELSQFAKAKTNAQITLEYKLSEAEKTIERICKEFNNDNGPMHMGEPVISNPFMDKLAAVTSQRDELLGEMHKILALLITPQQNYSYKEANYAVEKIAIEAIAKCEAK